MIAALFVATRGGYFGMPDVDPWDEKRDARLYAGPHPVVAHPPCQRWCRLAGLVEKTHGYKKGDDGGTFKAALAAVRTWGGVLEHPAYSAAFAHFGLPIPTDKGGWQRGLCGGWSCHVEQWHYGHRAKKATWLYAFGVNRLPSLRWGATPDTASTAYVTDDTGVNGNRGNRDSRPLAYVTDGGGDIKRRRKRDLAAVSWRGNKTKNGGEDRPRMGQREANATPESFRDLLIDIARGAA